MSVKIAIVGVGNCASSLVQGLCYYRNCDVDDGLILKEVCGYKVSDIEIVAAFDINTKKIGIPVSMAIKESPNSSANICNVDNMGDDFSALVTAGPVIDGVADNLELLVCPHGLQLELDAWKKIVVDRLRETKVDVLVSFLPVGSRKASLFYAECALEARVAFANAMPEFICSSVEWHEKFLNANVPCAGDDIKSQFGATYLHRLLVTALQERGHTIDNTIQVNSGGNLDFLNMTHENRLTSKVISKTEALTSMINSETCNLTVRVNDYVPELDDTKICQIFIQSRHFANCELTLEAKLTVQDSPNSAAVVVDIVRLLKVAQDKGLGGYQDFSAYYFKHPMMQYKDEVAKNIVFHFIEKFTYAKASENHV
jgi:myo-inositol-1-phosphate synthase